MKKYQTTQHHFELFRKTALHWIEYFGLKSWKVYFFHEAVDKESRAQVSVNVEWRSASIILNKEWDSSPKKYEIIQSAFHEICELLFWRLATMAYNRSNKDDINEETHVLIRTLENTVLNDSFKK